MSLQIRNSRDLLNPEEFRIKMLIIAPPGFGKTEFLSTIPNIGIAACETGLGNGLLSIAAKGVDYVTPASVPDLEAYCGGMVFKDKAALGLDSLSEMAKTFIKDYALTFPRAKGDSNKRRAGIPELDDYGTMGELTRKLLRKLLDQPKHVAVTALAKIKEPDPEHGVTETVVGPDLPGAMFYGAPAMFDVVLQLRTRQKLRNPNDAKSRYTERFFITQPTGPYLAKNRITLGVQSPPLLEPEEVFDPATGAGTFPMLLEKIQRRVAEWKQAQGLAAAATAA